MKNSKREIRRKKRVTKVRHKELEKNAVRVFSLFALANLYIVRRKLLQARV